MGPEMEVPEGSTIESLFSELMERYPKLGGFADSVAIARNAQFATPGEMLAEGDEIALLPPVSGGSAYTARTITAEGHFFALTREPIDTRQIVERVQQGMDGAVCTFEGVVRNNSQGRATKCLEYEGYEAMAMRLLEEIGLDIAGKHAISRIAMVHRLGRLEIGEASVVVVATAPHRRPSFDAALDGINRLKKTVPIWKKEHFEDGEVWVDGEWDDSVVRARGNSGNTSAAAE
jgi:molybdopterin synthase catalytic subunit